MKDNLQQQVAQFVPQVLGFAALNCVRDFVRLFDREWGDRCERLFEIPGTSSRGIAKRRHNLDEAANVARRLHPLSSWQRRVSSAKRRPPSAKAEGERQSATLLL